MGEFAPPFLLLMELQKILEAVCAFYGQKESEVTGGRRFKELVRPRHMFYYIAYELVYELNSQKVGKQRIVIRQRKHPLKALQIHTNKKDHGGIHVAIQKIKFELQMDLSETRLEMDIILDAIGSSKLKKEYKKQLAILLKEAKAPLKLRDHE